MSATNKHIIQTSSIQILTADVKCMLCKTVTAHIEAEGCSPEMISNTVRYWAHWMGHIYFSRDIMSSTSYEGAVRRAVNEELVKDGITCTRLHIAEKQILY